MGSQLNTSVPNRLPFAKNTTAEKLLVAASELMIERSSIEVSLSDIAQKSGVNAALVKYHFGNKDGLLHYLLHESSAEAADEVSKFFVAPLLDFHRRLLAEGVRCGEFRNIDPVLFYTSLIGACDHLFFGRHAMSRATGVGPVTDEVCRQYIRHMEALICGGMLTEGKERMASKEERANRE